MDVWVSPAKLSWASEHRAGAEADLTLVVLGQVKMTIMVEEEGSDDMRIESTLSGINKF